MNEVFQLVASGVSHSIDMEGYCDVHDEVVYTTRELAQANASSFKEAVAKTYLKNPVEISIQTLPIKQ